jgi:O-antigen/teichoic acid export membrane protein
MMIQDNIDEESWGKYAALYSLSHLVVVFSDLGINQYLTKEIASSQRNTNVLSAKLLGIKIISFLVFPFFMLGVGFLLGYEWKWLQLLFTVAIIHGLIQLFGFYRAQIQGKQLFKLEAFSSNIDKTLLILFGFLLLFWHIDIWLFAASRIVAISTSCLLIIYLCFKNQLVIKPSFNISNTQSVLKASLPFALISLAYGVNEKVDQVLIERLATNLKEFDHSAIYSASYRLLDAIMMYLWIVLPLFFAKFSHSNTDKTMQSNLINTGTALVFLPVAFLSLFCIFHSDLLFYVFKNYSSHSKKAMADIFSILCFTLLLQGLFAILSTYLTSTGKEKYVTKLVVLSILFNLIGNWIFIPIYGAYAAAWITFGSAVIVNIGYILKINRDKQIDLPIKIWFQLILISLLSVSAYYLGGLHSKFSSILLGGLVFLVTIVIIKPIKLSEIKNIR